MSQSKNDALVGMLRLKPGQSVAEVEASLRESAPQLVGSLLTWLHDDWYALAPDAARKFRLDRAANLERTDAAEYKDVQVMTYVEIFGMRNLQAGATTTAMRDRALGAGLFIEPPRFSRPGQYQGRPVQLDWQNAAADLPAAWEQLGDTGPAMYAGIRVAHIDTGYTEHPALGFTTPEGTWLRPDLGRNFWRERNEIPGVGEEPLRWLNERPEFDGPRDNLTGPFAGHGTRTQSLLAGLYAPGDEDLDFPFFGAAPGATIIPYRITDAVVVDHVSDLLAKAIENAMSKGAQVISISLGAVRPDREVAKAINAAYNAGVIICAAAGNVIPWVIYPGAFGRVVTVGGATTSNGSILHPWRGASRGPEVDISGPADAIRRGTTTRDGDGERFVIANGGDGTSFATAMCAGIAVLWLAKRGQELDEEYGPDKWARIAAFKHLLRATAQVPADWDRNNYGPGVYQAGKLLAEPLPPRADLKSESDAKARA